ncbi:ParB/RepB/Spo0J family partition protein [Azoarcus indigens]|uniref:ParB family protein n=1 Tax=Azoarcus indigens TaxID=29545 RepID=A0A4R6DYP6_9RHOO|nr:ParB/RepB/Spo0J family partition protein [Azoarcus indigens]NMG64916.1 ParB/RepB/Spo0J family partition protein [Azoarcus indigens]TDN50453.1 ParB family protein [Azoarcus indigens]
MAEFIHLELSGLAGSPTNPRKYFDPARLAELAETIRDHGVIEPIIVRAWPDEYETPAGRDTRPAYEIVAGERRYRASVLANAPDIPAIIRDLSTRQVVEIQVIENLQREEVSELEEAEGYALMMRDYGYTADQLAEKVGRSRAYIYSRLKLCDMTEAPREAFRAGQIKASVALLIARLPTADLQARATACIVAADMSARQAARHLQENNYMLQLERASWPLDEAFAGLPACLGCASNSSTDREQHADISPDVCTNQECFAGKRSAHLLRRAEQLSAQGQRVLIGAEARNVAPSGTDLYIHNGYIPVAREDWLQGKRQTVTEAYGDRLDTVPHTWIEDVRTGELVECVGRESLWELDRAAAADEPPAVVAEREQRQAERAAKERKIEQENEVREEIVGRIRTACRVAEIDLRAALMTIARHHLLEMGLDEDTAKHYAPDAHEGDQEQAIEAMLTWLNSAPPTRILGLLIEADVLDSSTWRAAYWNEESHDMPEGLANLAALYGIDIDQVRAEVQGGQPAFTAAETAPKTTPTPPQAAPAAVAPPAEPAPAKPARAKKAAPASGKTSAGKGKKEAATAAKKPKEKAKDSGRASPAKRKEKTAATTSAGDDAERDTRTIDMIAEAFPELGAGGTATQGQQEVRA